MMKLWLDEEAMKVWIASAQPGDMVTYHVGCLARDRGVRPELDRVAAEMMRLAEGGKVFLAQLRLGTFQWAYQATKAREPR